MKKIFTVVAIMLFCTFQRASSQATFELEPFAEGFNEPLVIVNAGDQHLFVGEKAGKIWRLRVNGEKRSVPFLDISGRVKSNGDEQGILGIAFHPQYKQNGFFFVTYTNKQGDIVLSRFNVTNNPHKAAGSSELILLVTEHPFENHNAGCLQFGQDGYLYMSEGDGGNAGDPHNNAQDPSVLLGKMLRLDVNSVNGYTIPPTNPFVGIEGYRPEIWAMGLRNPWRWSFDRLTGDMYIGDVGQDLWEEVDFQPASSTGGENYGWNCYEGVAPFEPVHCSNGEVVTFPIITYPHGDDCTVIGGYVYRGTQFPDMVGKYFFNDYCSGWYRMATQVNNEWIVTDIFKEEPFEYVAFGEAKNGELYVADFEGGEVLHLVQTGNKLAAQPLIPMELSLYPNPNSGSFTVEYAGAAEEKITMEVTNMLGQSVVSESINVVKGRNVINLSLPVNLKGNYMLVFHSQNGIMMKKFSVE